MVQLAERVHNFPGDIIESELFVCFRVVLMKERQGETDDYRWDGVHVFTAGSHRQSQGVNAQTTTIGENFMYQGGTQRPNLQKNILR